MADHEHEPLISLGDPDTNPEQHEYEDFPDQSPEIHLPAKKHHPIIRSCKYAIDAVREHARAWKNIYLCGWLIVGLELPMFVSTAPSVQLIEDAVCRQIYGRDFQHEMCQGKDVQTKIAEIKGVLAILSAIPSTKSTFGRMNLC